MCVYVYIYISIYITYVAWEVLNVYIVEACFMF